MKDLYWSFSGDGSDSDKEVFPVIKKRDWEVVTVARRYNVYQTRNHGGAFWGSAPLNFVVPRKICFTYK